MLAKKKEKKVSVYPVQRAGCELLGNGPKIKGSEGEMRRGDERRVKREM